MHYFFVHVDVDVLQLRQPHQIRADQDAQLQPLLLALLAILRRPLVLHAHPQFVHLGEVQQDEVDRILGRARFADVRSTERAMTCDGEVHLLAVVRLIGQQSAGALQ